MKLRWPVRVRGSVPSDWLAIRRSWCGRAVRRTWCLGADTIVEVKGEILGKPANAEDAARMLRMLSGKTHRVITGVCMAKPVGTPPVRSSESRAEIEGVTTASETTLVTMSEISDQEILEYVETGRTDG